jgi:2-polyprenyl-3-methyl-5-hydroxy-6-metoxy-1,4-benzoquinol methylase
MKEGKRPKATDVGLREWVLDGWLNSASGELTRGVRIRSTDTIIDVGCGDGGIIAFCARQGSEVIFIDRDEEKLAATEERIKRSPAHAYRAIASDCNPIPLADGTGDVVICTEVLEHVPDPGKFLGELIRITKPGGQLLVTVPDARSEKLVGSSAPAGYFEAPNHIRVFAADELRELMLEAGLQIESEQLMGAFWSMYLSLSYLTTDTTDILPLDNPHPVTDHWTRLWLELQKHPQGQLIRDALNQLIPRTLSIVARKAK